MKRIPYTGTHEHSHNKGGLLGEMKSLMSTRHFGAKRRDRHLTAKARALRKARGDEPGVAF